MSSTQMYDPKTGRYHTVTDRYVERYRQKGLTTNLPTRQEQNKALQMARQGQRYIAKPSVSTRQEEHKNKLVSAITGQASRQSTPTSNKEPSPKKYNLDSDFKYTNWGDENKLSDKDKYKLQQFTKAYQMTDSKELKKQYHDTIESIRKRNGYSGGADGSEYITEPVKNDPLRQSLPKGPLRGIKDFKDKSYQESLDSLKMIEDMITKHTEATKKPEVLSFEEALRQAKSQINPIYENNKDNLMEAIDQNALQRGFFGQLPTEAFKGYKSKQLANENAARAAQLANTIQGKSQAQANAEMQRASNDFNNLVSRALQIYQTKNNLNSNFANSMLGFYQLAQGQKAEEQKSKQAERDYNIKLAEKTGVIPTKDGVLHTLDYIETMGKLFGNYNGFKTLDARKFEETVRKNNASISQAWSRIANDKNKLALAQQRLGLDYDKHLLDKDEFAKATYEKAFNLALKEYTNTIGGNKIDEDLLFTIDDDDKKLEIIQQSIGDAFDPEDFSKLVGDKLTMLTSYIGGKNPVAEGNALYK